MRIIKTAAEGPEEMGPKEELVSLLVESYQGEIETMMNYLSAGTNIKRLGIKAEEVSEALVEDVPSEIEHAQKLAERLHTMGQTVPCSTMFEPSQTYLSCENHDDIVRIIKAVMKAEKTAIERYRKIAELCELDGVRDFATLDIVSEFIMDEEEHLREFSNFLAEYSE